MTKRERFIATEPSEYNPQMNGWANWDNIRYRNSATVVDTLRSGRDVYWRGILRYEPPVLKGFMNRYASNLKGSPPASLVLVVELNAPQEFLNGQSAQGLYRASAREISDQDMVIDPVAYILEQAGIPILASDLFAAMQLKRRIPWERDIPGHALLAFLQNVKQHHEEATPEKLLPVSMWTQPELTRSYAPLPGTAPLTGLLDHLRREAKKKGIRVIDVLREKLDVPPTVDEFIEAMVVGKPLTPDQFTPAIISGLLTRATTDLDIERSELTGTQLKTKRYPFLGGKTLLPLEHYAKKNKQPDETIMEFLERRANEHEKPEIEARRQQGRLALIKIAKRIGDLDIANGGILTYDALERSGFFRRVDLREFFNGGEEEFLEALGLRRTQTVYTAPEASK